MTCRCTASLRGSMVSLSFAHPRARLRGKSADNSKLWLIALGHQLGEATREAIRKNRRYQEANRKNSG